MAGADLSGLRSFHEAHPDLPCVVACLAPRAYRLGDAEVLPWQGALARVEGALTGRAR